MPPGGFPSTEDRLGEGEPELPALTEKTAPTSLRMVTGTGEQLVAQCLAWIAEKPAETGAQRAWQYYVLRYVVAHNAKPTQKAEFFVNLDRLVNEHGVEGVILRLNTYFDAPPFPCQGGSKDFGRFVKFFDQLAGTPTSAIVRTLAFEEAASNWLATANGHAKRIPSEILALMTKKEVPY